MTDFAGESNTNNSDSNYQESFYNFQQFHHSLVGF